MGGGFVYIWFFLTFGGQDGARIKHFLMSVTTFGTQRR